MTRPIFVFGSNLSGFHGAGSAREAMDYWGAKYRVGVGPTGSAYALPTKDEDLRALPIRAIRYAVERFTEYAREHPELTFIVSRVGCGLAGFDDGEMAPLFADAATLPNVLMCDVWREIIGRGSNAPR